VHETNESQKERKNATRKKVHLKYSCNRRGEVVAKVKTFVKELLPLQVGSTAVRHKKPFRTVCNKTPSGTTIISNKSQTESVQTEYFVPY